MWRNLWTARLAPVALAPMMLAMTGAGSLTLQPESRLWIEGTSTARSFRCDAAGFGVTVETLGDGAVAAVMLGVKAVSSVSVRVPAAQLDCRNGTMNDHMRKALKAGPFPEIAFRMTSYDLARAPAGVAGTITGILTLGGVERTIRIPAQGVEQGGALRITGSQTIRMTEYGLRPPTLMLGALKVNDPVKVGFDLLLAD